MLTQHEWVEGCYAYYAENGYEPGNPEDGVWEEAHYPVPKCEGGEATVLLLKQHHAVQGVLQSEEYQRPCIFGWEAEHLEGEMLALFEKWRSERGRLGGKVGGPAMWDALTPEERRERQLAAAQRYNRDEMATKVSDTLVSQGYEARRARALKAAAARTPEQRSEIARKSAATRAAKRLAREAAMLQNVSEA